MVKRMSLDNPEEHISIWANREEKLAQVVEVISDDCQLLRMYTSVMKTKSLIGNFIISYLVSLVLKKKKKFPGWAGKTTTSLRRSVLIKSKMVQSSEKKSSYKK